MSGSRMMLLVCAVVLVGAPSDAFGRGGGFRGGGGGARMGGGGGGGFRMGGGGGGGFAGAARPSGGYMGGGFGGGGYGGGYGGGGAGGYRPNFAQPSISRPAVSRPSNNFPSYNRPGAGSFESAYGAYGAMKPSNRPNSFSGVNRSNLENRANLANRPSTRPSFPDLGGGSLAGNRPGADRDIRPGGERFTPGELGDFLGMDKPLRPETLPGVTRPGGGDRPAIANRPVNREGFERPRAPGTNDRPVNINNINLGNNTRISNRPTWANIDRNQVNAIGDRWQGQINGLQNWQTRNPARTGYWNGWANGVRTSWNHWHNPNGWFGPGWWHNHPYHWCGWNYGYWFNRYPWSYWWTYPTYGALTNWFAWSAPQEVWSEPVYYDYGDGGNVTYQDNSVYIGGEQVASADQFAQSAMDLATVPPPPDQATAESAEWLPLGTFAVSKSDKDVDPNCVMQLAVDKQGVISGTLFNSTTDSTQAIQGQVDKNTQRVAFRVGDSQSVVLETGIYNLTQDEAPVLVHFGKDRTENWLLVRMKDSGSADGSDAANSDSSETTNSPFE